ncbi:DUF4386 family protein [Lysinimonas soli]|uniref:DUF4386 family protein n=1 Tax=Lysinimonas soli TaxID=1074233 RepID=A0ABW0NTB4_9MICO
MNAIDDQRRIDAPSRPLLRVGAVAAIVVVVLIPLQALVFIISPPPHTVPEYFALFERNPFLGLIDLDLLLTFDYLAMIPFYLALFLVLRRSAEGWALLALVTGLFGLVLYLFSREGTFSMWQLSSQYAAATAEGDRAALLGAGQTLLTLYNGGSFGISYVLGGISTLIFSAVMLRHRVVGRAPGIVGIVTGATMLVPANVGVIGTAISLLSLIPTAIWLILLSRGLLRAAREGLPAPLDPNEGGLDGS